jgi:hypothetical protein
MIAFEFMQPTGFDDEREKLHVAELRLAAATRWLELDPTFKKIMDDLRDGLVKAMQDFRRDLKALEGGDEE